MHIDQKMKEKAGGLLNIYITAGFPNHDSLIEIIPALEEAGVDMIEIGLPYSDPLSDGPTIQQSSAVAIQNGIRTAHIFEQISKINTQVPLLLMGYFNTVYQFGVEAFCKTCREVGVSGLIIPDLPLDIYLNKYRSYFEDNNLSNIFLVTPETSDSRIRFIDENSGAFIYAVSSSSTTGTKKNISATDGYFKKLSSMRLQTPLMVGFNIREKADFDFVCQFASGGIIGSAFINHIKDAENLGEATIQFVNKIRS